MYHINTNLKILDKLLIPTKSNKILLQEVSTPYDLRQDMLDEIPNEFWTLPKKVFEPCSGKGGFVLDIIQRFMNGLTYIEDPIKRYKYIVEECIFFNDINIRNVDFVCNLLDPLNEYKLNYNVGDTLKLDVKKFFDIDSFDLVIGNPPFNVSQKRSSTSTLYPKFIKKCIGLVKKNGYFSFLTPPGWRRPCSLNSRTFGFFNLMTKENQMINLTMYSFKEAKKLFNCDIFFDTYLIENKPCYKPINVIDMFYNQTFIDPFQWEFLPHGNFDFVKKVLSGPTLDVETDCFYDLIKKCCNDTLTDDFIHPVIKKINNDGEKVLMYSNVKKEKIFKKKKIVFNDKQGVIIKPFIDRQGEYGYTRNCISISYENLKQAEKITECFKKDTFKEFLKLFIYSSYAFDKTLFTYFNKKFYEFF